MQTSKGLWSQKRDLRPLKHEALEPDNGPEASDTLEALFTDGASPGCTRAAPGSTALEQLRTPLDLLQEFLQLQGALGSLMDSIGKGSSGSSGQGPCHLKF